MTELEFYFSFLFLHSLFITPYFPLIYLDFFFFCFLNVFTFYLDFTFILFNIRIIFTWRFVAPYRCFYVAFKEQWPQKGLPAVLLTPPELLALDFNISFLIIFSIFSFHSFSFHSLAVKSVPV